MSGKAKKQVTIRGESVEIVEHLCQLTGLTPRHVVELMLRKYGRELESWIGGSSRSTLSTPGAMQGFSKPSSQNEDVKQKIEMPLDPGKDLKPIQL